MKLLPSAWGVDFKTNSWRLRVRGCTNDGRTLEDVVELPFAELMGAKEATWIIKKRKQDEAELKLATRLQELEQDVA